MDSKGRAAARRVDSSGKPPIGPEFVVIGSAVPARHVFVSGARVALQSKRNGRYLQPDQPASGTGVSANGSSSAADIANWIIEVYHPAGMPPPPPPPPLLTRWTSEELKAHMQAVLDGRAEGRREALAVESREGLRLLTEFRATSASQVVLYVERVRNELQRLHYGSTLRAMETRGDGVGANQHWLWHGTRYATVLLVVKNGFNRSYSTTAAYGKCLYFAWDAAYSVPPWEGAIPPTTATGAGLFTE